MEASLPAGGFDQREEATLALPPGITHMAIRMIPETMVTMLRQRTVQLGGMMQMSPEGERVFTSFTAVKTGGLVVSICMILI